MTYPWITGAAMLAGHQAANEAQSEGGNLYPSYEEGTSHQARSSAYYGQNYGEQPRPPEPAFNSDEYTEREAQAKFISELVHYMMVKMEPTDRCLRPPGDYYTVADMERDAEEARIRREKRESEGLHSGE
jgi:hypothetical protein